MNKPYLRFALLAAVAVLAGLAAGSLWLHPGSVRLASGELLDTPRPIADFTLTGGDGQPFTRSDLLGHWSLIYVGYTYCPDVCPTTLMLLKNVERDLGRDAGRLRVVFISVDPARDTPQRLADYVHYFSPDFSAATGPDAVLEALGKNLGFAYNKVPGKTPDSYLMDHSAALMLIDPQARLAGYLLPPFKVQALVEDLRRIIERG
ncbi:MAG: SCO family protein [Sinobacteraceae bacterium]|nr:SCO family protein [Nevskiaceae bacterium]